MEFETFGQLVEYIGTSTEYGTAWVATCTLWQLLKENKITDQEVRALVAHLRGEGDI